MSKIVIFRLFVAGCIAAAALGAGNLWLLLAAWISFTSALERHGMDMIVAGLRRESQKRD